MMVKLYKKIDDTKKVQQYKLVHQHIIREAYKWALLKIAFKKSKKYIFLYKKIFV